LGKSPLRVRLLLRRLPPQGRLPRSW